LSDFDAEQTEDGLAPHAEKAMERDVGVEGIPEQAGGLELGDLREGEKDVPDAPDAMSVRPAISGTLGEHGVPPGGDRVFVGFDDFLDEAACVPIEARVQLGAGDPAFFEFIEELRRGRVKGHPRYCGEMGEFAK
jgi:hypothetical protein